MNLNRILQYENLEFFFKVSALIFKIKDFIIYKINAHLIERKK